MSHSGYHDAHMPHLATRFVAGMAVAAGLSACAAMDSATAPQPSGTASAPRVAPTPSGVAWAQDLVFTGDLGGRLTGVVPNQPGQSNQCTGFNSKTTGKWVSQIYGPVAGGVYGVLVTVDPYRGPGTYTAGTTLQVHSADQKQVWEAEAGDPVKFGVNNDEQSGTIDATLTNLADNKGKLHLTGSWSCRT